MDCKSAVVDVDLSVAKSLTEERSVFACDENFAKVALHFMSVNNVNFPKTFTESKILYDNLLSFVANI